MQAEQSSTPVCIFCHADSSESRSWEHIVPEALENESLALPPGTVCDTCNNYLGRKVEGPILNSAPMLTLRQMLGVGNKRGRVPAMDLVLQNGTRAQMRFDHRTGQRTIELDVPENWPIPPVGNNAAPNVGYAVAPESLRISRDLARFTAKSGFEYVALQNLLSTGSEQ